VASEGRHRFGIETALGQLKRRSALAGLRQLVALLSCERDFLLIRPRQSFHSNRTKRQAYEVA
jgi:hypothetical protein